MKSGFIAIVGRPNVGKSTLLNRILGEKIAITSPRPQTTRHRIRGVLTIPDAQMVFIDTPGIHKPQHQLGENLVKAATGALEGADLRLFVVDATELAGKGDAFIAEVLKESKGPVILVLNKADQKGAADSKIRQSYVDLLEAVDVLAVSARTGKGLADLLTMIKKHLPEGPAYYSEEEYTDQTERMLASELIREQVLTLTSQEIPHSVAVKIDDFHERTDLVYIRGHILVERDSQKGILIGEGGSMIKNIGQRARQAIEEMMGQKVFLDLQVKVLKNWRQNAQSLKQLGYIVE